MGNLQGKTVWTKRDKASGEFMTVKKSENKFMDVRREARRPMHSPTK